MKKCSRCKKEKTYEGFYKDKSTKDGYNSICKKCRLFMDRERRNKDPEWVERRQKHNSEFHVNNREKISLRKKEWVKSENGKKSHYLSSLKYRKSNPEKRKAHNAVYRAIKKGELVRPKRCQICDEEGKIEAHHASYDNGKRTSIIWVCKCCHESITRRNLKWHR